MAKWSCPCGNRIQSSGPIPNPQEWSIVSSHDLDKVATAAELNDDADMQTFGDYTRFVYRCEACDRLHVLWDQDMAWPPTIYAPESRSTPERRGEMANPTRLDIRDRLRRFIKKLPQLPATDAMHAQDLLDAGELTIAFEVLCTQIYEWSVPVTSSQVDTLDGLGRLLATNPKYVNSVRELIVSNPPDHESGTELDGT